MKLNLSIFYSVMIIPYWKYVVPVIKYGKSLKTDKIENINALGKLRVACLLICTILLKVGRESSISSLSIFKPKESFQLKLFMTPSIIAQVIVKTINGSKMKKIISF